MKFLSLLIVLVGIVSSIGEYSQRYSDAVMDQRLCVSLLVGEDYLQQLLSHVINGYIRFYNMPELFEH